jgi:hypothetical protein
MTHVGSELEAYCIRQQLIGFLWERNKRFFSEEFDINVEHECEQEDVDKLFGLMNHQLEYMDESPINQREIQWLLHVERRHYDMVKKGQKQIMEMLSSDHE